MKTKKSFRKMCVCFLAAWLFPQWSIADNVQKLVISKNDNTEVSFLLSEEPIIKVPSYDFNSILIKTATEEILLYANGLNKMVVVSDDDILTKTDNLLSQHNAPFFWHGNAFLVNVSVDETVIEIYGVDGKTIISRKLGQGHYAFSLTELPKGICIIKINNECYKIYNR